MGHTYKYWLDSDGNVLVADRLAGVDSHHTPIAMHHLLSSDVQPSNTDDDIYNQMYSLGFMRVAEECNGGSVTVWADNGRKQPTAEQRDFLLDKQFKGCVVKLNSELYESTRDGRENARSSMSEVLRKAMDVTMGR